MTKKIIAESINRNPIGVKEALSEELRNRVSIILERKLNEKDDDDEDEDDDEDDDDDEDEDDKDMKEETDAEYRRKKMQRESHGPLMKASKWIGKQSLEKLAHHPEINDKKGHTTLYHGHIHDEFNPNKKTHVALLSHGKPDESHISSGYNHEKVGYHKNHAWYEDTGLGHKFHRTSLRVTGHVHIHPDGKVEHHGNSSEMKRPHNLMVYK